MRSDQEIADGDRALLEAVGSQMARNLQRDEARKRIRSNHPFRFSLPKNQLTNCNRYPCSMERFSNNASE